MSKSETYAKIILNHIRNSDKKYFVNNFNAKKWTGLKSGEIREGLKTLQKAKILTKYRRAVYQINWTLIKK